MGFEDALEKEYPEVLEKLNLFHYGKGPVNHVRVVLTFMANACKDHAIGRTMRKCWRALDRKNADAVKTFFDEKVFKLQQTFAGKYFGEGKHGKYATALYEVLEKGKNKMMRKARKAAKA